MQRLATIELKEVATLCQLDEAELFELVEYGAITVIENEMNGTCISSDCIDTLQKAAQIRHDFVLDLFTMAILMNFIQKITDLEKKIFGCCLRPANAFDDFVLKRDDDKSANYT